MIAYNKQWLYNIYVRKRTEEVYQAGDITVIEKDSILAKHPYLFYTPNIFIRIGLFLLTILISISSIGLFSLPFLSDDIEHTIAILAIMIGLGYYAALEFFTRKKNHFNSGVDHALMLITAACLITGFNILFNISLLTNSLIGLLIAGYFAARFSDAFMSIVAFCCLVYFVTFAVILHLPGLKYYLPFILIVLSVLGIIGIKKLNRTTYYRQYYYYSSLLWLEIIAAIGLYTFGNYYVVKEIGNSLLNPQSKSASVPFAFIFWILTLLAPLVYGGYGIIKKKILYIRLGLVCLVAMAVTIRYYYNLLPAEIVLTLGGIILTGAAWLLIRYLKQPRNGYTSLQLYNNKDQIKLESVIVIESVGHNLSSNENQMFKGGSGGGGGASSDY